MRWIFIVTLTAITLDIFLYWNKHLFRFCICLHFAARHSQCQGVPKFNLHFWKEIPLIGFECTTF